MITPMLRPDLFGALATHAGDALYELLLPARVRQGGPATCATTTATSGGGGTTSARARPSPRRRTSRCSRARLLGGVLARPTTARRCCRSTRAAACCVAGACGSGGWPGTRCGWSTGTPTRCAACARSGSTRATRDDYYLDLGAQAFRDGLRADRRTGRAGVLRAVRRHPRRRSTTATRWRSPGWPSGWPADRLTATSGAAGRAPEQQAAAHAWRPAPSPRPASTGVSTPSAITSAPASRRRVQERCDAAGADARPGRDRSTWTIVGADQLDGAQGVRLVGDVGEHDRQPQPRISATARLEQPPGRPARRRAPRRRRPARAGRGRTRRPAAGDRRRGRSGGSGVRCTVSRTPAASTRSKTRQRNAQSSRSTRPRETASLEQRQGVGELGAGASPAGGLPADDGVVGQPAYRLEVGAELAGVGDELFDEGPGSPGAVELVDKARGTSTLRASAAERPT